MTVSNGKSAEAVLDKLIDDCFGLHSVSEKAKKKALAALEEIMDKQVIGEDVIESTDPRWTSRSTINEEHAEQRHRLIQAFSNGGGE